MRAIVIARFVNTKTKEFTGVRLLRLPDKSDDIDNWLKEVSDISINKLRTVLKNKLIDVVNTKLKGNTIIGKDNTFKYSEVISDSGEGVLLNNGIITILYKIQNGEKVGYLVTDSSGTVKAFDKSVIERAFNNNVKYTNLFIRNGVIQTTAPSIIKNRPKGKLEQQNNSNRMVNGLYKLKYEINDADLIHGYKEKYSRYDHKIPAREIMEKQLTDVPAELVDFWDIKEFKGYMDAHGLKYRILPHSYNNTNYCDIIELDISLKVLVVPKDIIEVKSFIDSIADERKSDIEVIYIPESVESVTDDLFIECQSLKKIVFHNNIREMPIIRLMNRIKNLGVEFNIPYYIERLYGIFAGRLCHSEKSICNINLSILPHLVTIDNSFNDLSIESINFGYAQKVDDSFRCANTLFSELVLGKFIKEIEGQSFLGLAVSRINFKNAYGLKVIDYSSFSSLSNITEVDLSNNLRLETISSSAFSDCPLLAEVKLPQSLKYIDERAFSDCKNLKRVNIPESVRVRDYVFRNCPIDDIDIPFNASFGAVKLLNANAVLHCNDTLKFGRLSRCNFKKLSVTGDIKKVGYQALLSCSFEHIELPDTIEVIDEEAFWSANIQPILDIRNLKNLKEIGEKAFAFTNISKVILPDNLKEIGDMAFSQCEYLEAIYIPGSLTDIGKRLFFKSSGKAPFKLTIYTQENTPAYKYFNSKFDIVCVKDSDEAYKLMTEQVKISESKLAKLKIILGNDPVHQILFTPKYENIADKLYDIYKMLSMKQGVDIKDINNINYSNSVKFSSIIDKLSIEGQDIGSVTSEIRYSNFVGVFKLMQRLRPNNIDLLKDKTLAKLFSQGYNIRLIRILENKEHDAKIIQCRISLKYTNYGITAFIFGDDIVFCTAYKVLYIDLPSWFDNSTIEDSDVSNVEDIMLKHNDTVFSAFRVTSRTIPHYIDLLFVKQIRKQCIIVGAKLPKNHKVVGGCTVYLYNMMTCKIIEVEATYDLNNSASRTIQNSTISAIMLKGIYNLEDITDDMVNSMVLYIFNLTDTKQFIEKILDENYFTNLCNKENAYDENVKPCLEWQLSCALQKIGMDKLEKLNKDAIKYMFDTVFFSKSTKRLGDIKQAKQTGSIKTHDGVIITEYRINSGRQTYNTNMIGGVTNYFYIIGTVDTNKSTCRIYNSHYSITNILNILYNMADRTKPGDVIISDDPTENEFTPIGKEISMGVLSEDIKSIRIYTAVCKGNGQAFLMMNIDSYGEKPLKYTVFRYRSLKECIKYASWIYGEMPEKGIKFAAKSMQDDIYLIARKFIQNISRDTDIIKARNYIINGYPNGYELCGNEKYLFDWAAKQRKKQ